MIARRVTQRAVAGAALAVLLPILAGCGIDASDQTSNARPQVQAADHTIGAVRIRDAYITTLPDATGANTNYLVVTLVNDGRSSDTFTGISTSLGTGTFSKGPVTLPKGVVVQLSDPEIDPTAPTLTVSGATPTVGTTVGVKFSFADAGTTGTIPVPIVTPGANLNPTQLIPTTQDTPTPPIV